MSVPWHKIGTLRVFCIRRGLQDFIVPTQDIVSAIPNLGADLESPGIQCEIDKQKQ